MISETPNSGSTQGPLELLIRDEIIELLNRDSSSGAGAILITGEWGAGKTYFWRNTIAPKLRNTHLYVSLAGVTTTNEAYERILSSYMTSDTEGFEAKIKKGAEVAKKAIKSLDGGSAYRFLKSLSSDYKNVNRHVFSMLNLSSVIPHNCVYCFDDIERSSIDISSLLGICIHIQETLDGHVVLITNQSKINDGTTRYDEFLKHKEKLVWKSFEYRPEIEKIFEQFREKLEGDHSAHQVLKEYERVILRVFKKGNTNLRVLYRCMQDVTRIASAARGYIHFKYIEFFCALYLWHLSGNELLHASYFQDRSLLTRRFVKNDKDGEKPTEAELGVAQFFQTYFQERSEIGFSEEIFNYVKTGYLDAAKLKNEIFPPEPTRGVALLKELDEQKWFFSSDTVNNKYVSDIMEILAQKSEEAYVGFGLGLQIVRICSHSLIPLPEDFADVFEDFLREKVKRSDREKLERYHSRTQSDTEFLKIWTPIYREISDKDASRFWAGWFKEMALSGSEINTYETEIRGEETLAIALTDSDLLDAIDQVRQKNPDIHYSFFIRAKRRIDESALDPSKKRGYLKILKGRISTWTTIDHSEATRKNYLLTEFYNNLE